MADIDDHDEDLFADLYDGDDTPAKPTQAPAQVQPDIASSSANDAPAQSADYGENGGDEGSYQQAQAHAGGDVDMHASASNYNNGNQSYEHETTEQDANYGPINVKEDG